MTTILTTMKRIDWRKKANWNTNTIIDKNARTDIKNIQQNRAFSELLAHPSFKKFSVAFKAKKIN